MKLRRPGKNITEIEASTGNTVLFSYQTPVAAHVVDDTAQKLIGLMHAGFIRTNKYYSVTTSRHINKWLDGARAIEVDQSVLDSLVIK